MAIAFVPGSTASANFGSSAAARTLAWGGANTAGNLLVVLVTTGTSTALTVTVSDSINGSYTLAGSYSTDGTHASKVSIWYVANCASGTPTVTVTPSATAYITLALQEYSGVATSTPLHSTITHQGTSATNPTTGTCTAASGELVVAAYGSSFSAGASCTVDTPFTFRANQTTAPGMTMGTADDVNAAGSEGASFHTASSLGEYAAIAASFKAASAPAGAATQLLSCIGCGA